MSLHESSQVRAAPGRRFDDELLPIFFGLWLVSVLRACGPLLRGETYGAEATLALLAALFLPLAMAESIGHLVRRMIARRGTK